MRARTLSGVAALALLSGCADWREGPETVESCVTRHSKDKVDFLDDDQGIWIPSYTYDITKLDIHMIKTLVEAADHDSEPGTAGVMMIGSANGQHARESFEVLPATEAGAVLLAEDPALYKVRGKPGLYRDILRQGCEAQRPGMRLLSYRFTRKEAFVDGRLPPPNIKSSDVRKIVKPAISSEDLLP